MSTDVSAEILAKLRSAAETGSLDGLGIDYFDRGGPPGAGYEADVLLVRPAAEVLLRTRFDRSYMPPFRTEEYVGQPAGADTVRALSTLSIQAFEGSFAEEEPSPIGGVTKISLKAYIAGAKPAKGAPPLEIVKTFFQKLPAELAALGDLVRARMTALTEQPPNIVSTPALR